MDPLRSRSQAQELQQVLPSLVRKVEDDHLAVVYQEPGPLWGCESAQGHSERAHDEVFHSQEDALKCDVTVLQRSAPLLGFRKLSIRLCFKGGMSSL